MSRRCVSLQTKHRLFKMPCVICGLSGDTEADHIVSRALGGSHEDSNLQPLCRVCNVIKRDKRTNDEVAQWIAENPKKFEEMQARRRMVLHCRVYGWY